MRRLALMLGVAVGLASLVAMTMPARAETRSGDSPQVPASQTINDDLYIAGQNVVVNGTVNGDVYAAGQSVTIKGTINGDVLAAGQTVMVSGQIRGSVRTTGQTVQLSGAQVGGSFSGLGQNVSTDSDSTIGGGMNGSAQNLIARAKVSRGITAAAARATLDGEAGRDVIMAVDQLTLGANARLGGNLKYYSDHSLVTGSGGQVAGATTRIEPNHRQAQTGAAWFGFGFRLWSFVSAFIIGVLMLVWLRQPTQRVADVIIRRPWPTLGWGLLGLLLAIPVLIMLMITVIGLPLAIILAILVGVSLYLAKIFVALAAAEWIWKSFGGSDQSRPGRDLDAICNSVSAGPGLVIPKALRQLLEGLDWCLNCFTSTQACEHRPARGPSRERLG